MWIQALENETRGARPRAERRSSFEASCVELRMFNVGHGEAMLVIFPGARAWLLDGGNTNNRTPNERLGQLLVRYLEDRKLTLEACVASHPHVDHVGALETILTSGSTALAPTVTVYRGEDAWNADRRWLDRYHQMIADLGPAVQEVILRDAHRQVTIADGVVAHLFAGSRDGPYTSLFMQLRYRSARLLFTGDAYCAYEVELLDAFGHLDFRADMLKITHHGSSSGTARRAVDAARPAFAIASTGDDAGHRLEADTLERVLGSRQKRRVFETLVRGDIVVRTDGEPYRRGILYQLEFNSPGQFAAEMHAEVTDEDQIERGRSDHTDCQ